MWKSVRQFIKNFWQRKRMVLLYLICIIAPLIITDGVILTVLIQAERDKSENEMKNIAEAVSYELSSVFEIANRITNSIYQHRGIDDFLNTEFETNLDFYERSRRILDSVYYDMAIGYSSAQLLLYADNDTIVNGGHFQRTESAEEMTWYREFQNSGRESKIVICYEEPSRMSAISQRRVSLIRRLDYFRSSEIEKIVKLDLDYNSINRKLENMNFAPHVYVCEGDAILFSNSGNDKYTEPFEVLTGEENIGYELSWDFYEDKLRILVEYPENMIHHLLKSNMDVLLILLGINIVLMGTIMNLINRSYMDRLARQEMELARQNAEIQALHSQINPHFLFNVLESIRMHSVLKKEDETAEMIARLAQLERQSVKWNSDYVSVSEELQFVESYLELQKYRFGKRLSYEIQAAPECGSYLLPRLTMSTFVENACVHGMEGKQATCWVYVRVYQKEDRVCLEIEDTGRGMSEEQTALLLEKIRSCDIHTVKKSSHIGVLNACLRLKIATDDTVEFEIESEEGAGSWFMIRIPVKMLGRMQ